MSNHIENMILDQDVYNEQNKEVDLEDKAKNFYPQIEQKNEEKDSNIKSAKTFSQIKEKEKKGINTSIKNKKQNHSQINENNNNKSDKYNFSIKLIKKSESEIKKTNKSEETELIFKTYSNENMINYNNIMDIDEEKNEDLFKKENEESIKDINENGVSEEYPQENNSVKDPSSTVILLVGGS